MPAKALLVSLPWPRIDHFSVQLGALAGYLTSNGKHVEQRNYAKDIRGYLDRNTYDAVVANDLQQYEAAALLFPDRVPAIRDLICRVAGSDFDVDRYLENTRAFFDDVVLDIAGRSYDILGFTVSFLQFLPSVYVARRVKEHRGEPVVIGGAALVQQFAQPILSHFPDVDLVAIGEGEQTLLELVTAIEEHRLHDADIPGISRQSRGRIHSSRSRDRLPDLDELPTPDFSGQFSEPLPRNTEVPLFPTITLEASRGCFYGKCSFCNLNCQWDNTFRMKSDDAVVRDLTRLVVRHRTCRVMFCDTNVSNRRSLFEKIRDLGLGLDVILEVSGHADGAHREFYRTIKAAGAAQIQIGVESFSPRLLRLIRKGVTVCKNVEMLKWCGELGINVFYNILSHIPGETQADVGETLAVMEYLKYYQPPTRVCEFYLAHDSPAYEHPELFHVAGWTVPEEIRACFPPEIREDLSPLMTPIVGFPASPTVPYADWEQVLDFVKQWQEIYTSNHCLPGMFYRDSRDFLTIEISKFGRSEYVVLDEPERSIYLACGNRPHRVEEIAELLRIPSAVVQRSLSSLVEARVVFNERGRYLSLAIPRDAMTLSPHPNNSGF